MRRFLFLIFSLFFISNCAVAQSNSKEDLSRYLPRYKYKPVKAKKDSLERVPIKEKAIVYPTHHVNNIIDSMFVKLKKHNESFVYAQGFRVQLYSGTNMGSATNIESKVRAVVSTVDGNHVVYRNYNAPTWKVRAGDFIDRLKAHRLYHQLKKHFPNALVVPDSEVLIKRIK